MLTTLTTIHLTFNTRQVRCRADVRDIVFTRQARPLNGRVNQSRRHLLIKKNTFVVYRDAD